MSGQNAEQYADYQHLGSVEMFVADYGTEDYVSLGTGEGFGYTETKTDAEGTPDNGEKPDILDYVVNQTIEATGTLWCYKLDLIAKMRGGIDKLVTDANTGRTTLSTGGFGKQNNVVIKAVQKTKVFASAADVTRWVTTPTTAPVSFVEGDPIIKVLEVVIFKGKTTSGESITYTNDKDGNPILKYPFTFMGREDNAIVDGTGNLFHREEYVVLPA